MMVIPRIRMKRFLVAFYGHGNQLVFTTEVEAVVSDLAFAVARSKLPDSCAYEKASIVELLRGSAAV